MKPSTKINILSLIAIASMFGAGIAKALGVGVHDFGDISSMILIFCGIFIYRIHKKAQVEGQMPEPSEGQKRKRLRLMVICGACVCLAEPFLLRSSGMALPFWMMWMSSVMTFLMLIGIIWLTTRLKR